VSSLEIKVDILPFFTVLSIFQENFCFQCINKVEHHTAERKKSSGNVGGWYSYSVLFQDGQ